MKIKEYQNKTILKGMNLAQIEDWCEENCKHPYRMLNEMTLNGIPLLFVNKQDWIYCCANWDIFTKEDIKPKGSLGVDADGNIVAF